MSQKPREPDLKQADEILEEYTKPYSMIDNGNLFFAAGEYQTAYKRLVGQAEKDKAEISRLEQLRDMDKLILNGLRRVLATSRMALNGNTKPLELALKDYDKSPLPPSDTVQDKLKAEIAEQTRLKMEAIGRYGLECVANNELQRKLEIVTKLSALQDKLLMCYRVGKQPGKWLDEMGPLRESTRAVRQMSKEDGKCNVCGLFLIGGNCPNGHTQQPCN